jgi:hypothetical protein
MHIQLSLQWLKNDYKSFDMNINNPTPPPTYVPTYLSTHPPNHQPTYLLTYHQLGCYLLSIILGTQLSTYLLTRFSWLKDF